MDKTAKGWQFPYVISAGNYVYKFIDDGKWMIDPANPFTTGSGNYENSFIALNTSHIFELNLDPNAKSAIVAGSFNGWTTKDCRMVKEGSRWYSPFILNPGNTPINLLSTASGFSIRPLNSTTETNTDPTIRFCGLSQEVTLKIKRAYLC